MGRNQDVFSPQPGDTFERLCDRAYDCGLTALSEESKRGKWIDSFVGEPGQKQALTEHFHVGQSEMYEQEDW